MTRNNLIEIAKKNCTIKGLCDCLYGTEVLNCMTDGDPIMEMDKNAFIEELIEFMFKETDIT